MHEDKSYRRDPVENDEAAISAGRRALIGYYFLRGMSHVLMAAVSLRIVYGASDGKY